jgi:hypothetical protein
MVLDSFPSSKMLRELIDSGSSEGIHGSSGRIARAQYDARSKMEQNGIWHDSSPSLNDGHRRKWRTSASISGLCAKMEEDFAAWVMRGARPDPAVDPLVANGGLVESPVKAASRRRRGPKARLYRGFHEAILGH